MHSAEGFTHANWWRASSWAGVMKVVEGFDKGAGTVMTHAQEGA
jgi:hypothetical protein